MNGSIINQLDFKGSLIDRLNGLITATLTSKSFSQAQRLELIKLFQITMNMISNKEQKYPNKRLPSNLMMQYTKLIDSFQNLINADRTSQLLKNNLTLLSKTTSAPPPPPTSTPSRTNVTSTNRKYGIFQDRVSNISTPSISTNSVSDADPQTVRAGSISTQQQLYEQAEEEEAVLQEDQSREEEPENKAQDSGSEFDEEEEDDDDESCEIYNSTSLLLPIPHSHSFSIGFPDSRLNGPNYHARLMKHNRLDSLYSLP